MKKIALLIIILFIGLIGYYYYNYNNSKISITSYEYIKIEKGNIKKTVSATGKIIPTSTLILSSEISGKIVDVATDYNEIVKKGDVLATFDQNPFLLNVEETETSVGISKSKLKQKKASLEKAKSELRNATSNQIGFKSKLNDFILFVKKSSKNLEDQKILYKNKYISKNKYEDYLYEYESAKYQLNTLESEILSLNAIIDSRKAQIKIINAEIEEVENLIQQTRLTLESEKLDLTKTQIISPINGFILDSHISVGDVLGAYQKDSIMFTIAETLSKMNIEIFIDESDIGNIKTNQEVEFSERKLSQNTEKCTEAQTG